MSDAIWEGIPYLFGHPAGHGVSEATAGRKGVDCTGLTDPAMCRASRHCAQVQWMLGYIAGKYGSDTG